MRRRYNAAHVVNRTEESTMRVLRRPRTIAGLLAFALAASPAVAQAPKDELPHPKTLEELKKVMGEVVEKTHVPGAGVALVSHGEVLWCGGIGKADIAAGRDITCDTEFRVGSVSKSFVALALLKLEEEGKINLQARVQDLAPEVPIKNAWEATNPVRVVNLLEHTAGFDDMSATEVYNTKDRADIALLQVFQAHPVQQNPRWPPSTRFSYSNPGFGLAGYLIEKTSGRPFDAYIKQAVLTPLGIETGEFRLTEANRALLAQGYQAEKKAVAYKEIYLRPAGDMKASPAELAKLVQFFLRRGNANGTQLVKPETIARMEYPTTPASARNGIRLGYGLANYTEVEGGVVTHGHDGGIDGFISTYRYMPEQNWGYVVLLNSDFSGKALHDLNSLAIDFLSKDFPKAQQPVVSLTQSELESFAGYYSPRAPRNQLGSFLEELTGGARVRAESGHLLLSGLFANNPEKLLPVGRTLFRGEKEPEATAVFFSDPSGTKVLVSAGTDGVPYGERESIFWPYARLALLCLCALLLASSLLFALVWAVRWVLGKMKGVQHLSVRAVPLVATLLLVAVLFSMTKIFDDLGAINLWTVTIFAGTILFALLSLVGLWLAVRVPRSEIRRDVRIHSLLVSLACVVLTVFFASWHLLGLRVWAP
jgi:CubicO group peptidase (beta-lactamase class C family)